MIHFRCALLQIIASCLWVQGIFFFWVHDVLILELTRSHGCLQYKERSSLSLQYLCLKCKSCTPLQLVIFSLVVEIKCNGLIGCCLIHLYDDLFKLFLLTTPPYSKGQLSCLSQLWDTWALLCMSQGYVQGYISHKILSIVAQTFSNESWDLEL